MLVRISASPDALRGPEYMQRAFAAMHQANGQRLPFTLEYGRLAGTVSLFLRFPPQLRPYIETPLVANYPDIAMQRVGEEALDPLSEHGQWSLTRASQMRCVLVAASVGRHCHSLADAPTSGPTFQEST